MHCRLKRPNCQCRLVLRPCLRRVRNIERFPQGWLWRDRQSLSIEAVSIGHNNGTCRNSRSVLLPDELLSGVKFIVYVVTVKMPEGKSEVRVTEQGSGTLS